MVGLGTYAADPVCDHRHILSKTTDAEPLKTPQLRDLEICIFDIPCLIEEYLYPAVAFEPRDRIDRYPFQTILPFRIELGRLYL